jgi:hypothetical protein
MPPDASGATLTLYFENALFVLSGDSNLVKADTKCTNGVANFRTAAGDLSEDFGCMGETIARLATGDVRSDLMEWVSRLSRSMPLCHMGTY